VGTRAMIGMGVVLGDDVQIGANASIDHFMRLPSESRVAQAEYARRERSSATKHEELATKVGP
jgi:acetyltransferase-like isoleucine patch superfamily enzyme